MQPPAILQKDSVRHGIQTSLFVLGMLFMIVSISGTHWYTQKTTYEIPDGVSSKCTTKYSEFIASTISGGYSEDYPEVSCPDYQISKTSHTLQFNNSAVCDSEKFSDKYCTNALGAHRAMIAATVFASATLVSDGVINYAQLLHQVPHVRRYGISSLALLTSLCLIIGFSLYTKTIDTDFIEESHLLTKQSLLAKGYSGISLEYGYAAGFVMAILSFIAFGLGAIYNIFFADFKKETESEEPTEKRTFKLNVPTPEILKRNGAVRNGIRSGLFGVGLLFLIVSAAGTTWKSYDYDMDLGVGSSSNSEQVSYEASIWSYEETHYATVPESNSTSTTTHKELKSADNGTHTEYCGMETARYPTCRLLLGAQRTLVSAVTFSCLTVVLDGVVNYTTLLNQVPHLRKWGISLCALLVCLMALLSFSLYATYLTKEGHGDYFSNFKIKHEKTDRSFTYSHHVGAGFVMVILGFLCYLAGTAYNVLYSNIAKAEPATPVDNYQEMVATKQSTQGSKPDLSVQV